MEVIENFWRFWGESFLRFICLELSEVGGWVVVVDVSGRSGGYILLEIYKWDFESFRL